MVQIVIEVDLTVDEMNTSIFFNTRIFCNELEIYRKKNMEGEEGEEIKERHVRDTNNRYLVIICFNDFSTQLS